MKKMTDMLKEGGVYSLTRVLPTLGYLVFIVMSIILAITGKHWDGYGTFAMATGGSIIVQLGNKWVNSKYNTGYGEIGKKMD